MKKFVAVLFSLLIGTFTQAQSWTETNRITGVEERSNFANQAAQKGDLTGDGQVDLLIGAANQDLNAGKAYVIPHDAIFENIDVNDPRVHELNPGLNKFCAWPVKVGNFNGHDSAMLGCGSQPGGGADGEANIYYGPITSDRITPDLKIVGDPLSTMFGAGIGTGDFNGDGLDDIVVGEGGLEGTNSGALYFFYQPIGGWTVSTLDSTQADHVIYNLPGGIHEFGHPIFTGDYDNDGTDDVMVAGILHSNNGMTRNGRGHLFYCASGVGCGDKTADQADALFPGPHNNAYGGYGLQIGALADGSKILCSAAPNWHPSGVVTDYTYQWGKLFCYTTMAARFSGEYTAASADFTFESTAHARMCRDYILIEDMDQDGLTDVVCGAGWYKVGASAYYDGAVYIWRGTSSGFECGASCTDQQATYSFFGVPDQQDGIGISVQSGDLDNNGRKELFISAHAVNNNTGQLWIYEFVPPDTDGDGAEDDIDNCLTDYNPDQLDSDLDLAGDVCDPCPSDDTDTCDQQTVDSEYVESDTGAVLTAPDGTAELDIPADALSTDSTISMQEEDKNDSNVAIGANTGNIATSYKMEPAGTTFSTAVTITLEATTTQKKCDKMRMFVDSGSGYQELSTYTCTYASPTCTCVGETLTFSSFAMITTDADGDGVDDNWDGVVDYCLDSVPDTMPNLKSNHWMYEEGDDLTWTDGCSCLQILDECKPGQNNGEKSKGCSPGTMNVFTTYPLSGWGDCLDRDMQVEETDSDGIPPSEDSEDDSSYNDGLPDDFCANKPHKCP